MNRLNPLYIIFIFLTIFIVSFYMLDAEKKNFDNKNIEYLNTSKNAKDYKSFKETWDNKVYVNKILNQILSNKIYKTSKILKTELQNSIKIKISSSEEKVLNDFLNKILNKQVIIKKLEMTKVSISLELGIN